MKKGSMLTALLLAMVMCFSGFAVAEDVPVVDDLVYTPDEQTTAGSEVTTLSAYEMLQLQAQAAQMYNDMVATTTLADFYAQLESAYYADEAVRALFTVDQTNALYSHADALYALEDPEDEDAYNLYEEVSALIAWVFGTDDARVYAALLTAGNLVNGTTYTLTGKVKLTGTLAVPANAQVTVDLNGYHLEGKGSGSFIFTVGKDATLTIMDSNPSRNNGAGKGYTGGIITNGNGDRGGAIIVTGNLIMNGGTIYGAVNSESGASADTATHDHTKSSGGAVYLQEHATFTMNGGTIAHCSTLYRGGAVFVDSEVDSGAVFTMNGGTIEHCSAPAEGGAVYVHSAVADKATGRGTFIMNGGTISDCSSSTHGGAVFVNAASTGSAFAMTGGTIKNCNAGTDATSHGGAVFVDSEGSAGSTFTMTGGTIENCNATNGYGGAVYLHNLGTMGSKFVLSGNASINECNARYGGAIFVEGKNGAVSQFEMTGGSITNNASVYHGGAVYLRGVFKMTDGLISGNETTNISQDTGKLNYYGGGVYLVDETAKFTMTGGTISNNTAASGGGVMVWEDSVFDMNGGVISGNHSVGGGGLGNGGAVYVQTGTFNFNGGQLLNNTAARYGGAVNINQTAIFNLTGSTGDCIVRGNYANYGGGLSQEAGDCQIELSSDKILIEDNTAEIDGGGLFIEKGVLNISGGTIKNNTAKTGKGGGISLRVNRIAGDVTVNMTGGVCTENTAATYGGGIDIFADFALEGTEKNDVVVNLKGGTISKNKANGGGGIHIGINEDNSTAVMYIGENSTGTLLQENEATTYGGAVHIENGSIYMYNGTAAGNSANQGGGVAYVSNGNFIMNNGDMNNNSAGNGGAVYVTGGDFTISDGAITNNTATAGGGAVYMADGDFHMNYGTVNSNKANNGGAVYMAGSNAVFTMKSGYMNSNEAKALSSGTGDLGGDGGAVYATSGTLYIGEENCPGGNDTSKHDANRSHPEIRLNSADDCGGGIAISDEGKVYFYCGSAKDNTALYKGVGLNVFMDGGYFYLYDGAELGAPREPYLVIIGGELNNMCETKTMLNLYYYQQQSDKEPYLKGLAEKDEIIDLPDGEYFMTKPSTDVSFFGWTAKGGSTLFVRNKNDYLPSGTAITIVDEEVASSAQNTWDETADNTIKLYALWAPSESKITYVDGMEYKVVTPYEPSKYTLQRADEYFTEIPAIPKAGYAVVGWYIYQDEGKNANWGYEPVYTSSTKSYETLDYAALKTNGQYLPLDKPGATLKLNTGTLLFGDITLIAIFEPQFASMRITKMPANAEGNFIFRIQGEPLDKDLSDVDMYVTAKAGTDNAVLITELPVGSYTVTEQTDWSWRYGTVTSVSPDNANGTASVNVTIDNPEAVEQVTFTNTKTENLWLDAEDIEVNELSQPSPAPSDGSGNGQSY